MGRPGWPVASGACSCVFSEDIHPGRLTWNLQITHLERKMIFQTSMIMSHVNLPGCIFLMFISIPGEMIQFDEHIFQRGLKPPTTGSPVLFFGGGEDMGSLF